MLFDSSKATSRRVCCLSGGSVLVRKVAPVYVRLKKKLANVMDGVDVSQARTGDLLNVSDSQGEMLIAEDWAEPFDSPDSTSGSSPSQNATPSNSRPD